MKRSRGIKLVLLGGLSVSALTGCDSGAPAPAPVTAEASYTNNFYVQGVGYYHAPFRAWFHLPYNYYDAKSGRYFYGGQWFTLPCVSITNISKPPIVVAQQAETQRTDMPPPSVTRGGFGSSSYSHFTGS